MRLKVSLTATDLVDSIARHLIETFGASGGYMLRGQGSPAPPPETPFEVTEPLQTCHAVKGMGLDQKNDNNLPVGPYRVVGWDNEPGSFKLLMKNLRSGDRVWCICSDQNFCMDWRGVQKAA